MWVYYERRIAFVIMKEGNISDEQIQYISLGQEVLGALVLGTGAPMGCNTLQLNEVPCAFFGQE